MLLPLWCGILEPTEKHYKVEKCSSEKGNCTISSTFLDLNSILQLGNKMVQYRENA